jgi:hypothetical protein
MKKLILALLCLLTIGVKAQKCTTVVIDIDSIARTKPVMFVLKAKNYIDHNFYDGYITLGIIKMNTTCDTLEVAGHQIEAIKIGPRTYTLTGYYDTLPGLILARNPLRALEGKLY